VNNRADAERRQWKTTTKSPISRRRPKKKRYQRTIFLPNSSPVPNWFFDCVLCDSDIPHAARSVFLFMLRKTVGWDNRVEELSLTEIQNGSGVTRPTAIHAVRIICDVWGLFHKSRGHKGQHSSVYAIGGLTETEFMERYSLAEDIYGTPFPKPEQLRDYPPTREVFESQKRKNAEEDQRRESRNRSKNILPMRSNDFTPTGKAS